MNTINFMDLKRQCKAIKNEIFTEIEKVYEDNAFISGKYTELFEKQFSEYIGSKYCLGISNGTDALFLACKALGIGPGDEVIVPSNTFIATAWAPFHCGAKVVFADCNETDWLIDPESVKHNLTDKTKAIIGVHLYGQPFNLDSIGDICKNNNIHLIEDCAQAHGAKWRGKNVGTFGDVGCFSFYPGKNLGAMGDAGGIVTNSQNLYQKIKTLKDHGQVEKYHHDYPGFNMRMDGFQAAILSVKLKHLQQWTERRKEIATFYSNHIHNEKIKLRTNKEESDGVNHIYAILVDDRDAFMEYMNKNGINCGIHYPIPCHLQKAFEKLNYSKGDFPVTEYVMNHCVSIPIYPELNDEEINRVVRAVNNY